MGRIPCSAHGGRNRGWRGAEYYYIRPPRCTYVRTYVRSTYTRVLRISWTLERRLEGGGRACTAPQPSGAHLLVRRSAARYLQRRANSWRGLLASLVTTVFSSWSTSIDLWSIVNARLIERAWVARPCTLALPARPTCLPAFHPTTRIYLFSLFFYPSPSRPILSRPPPRSLLLPSFCCLPSLSHLRHTGYGLYWFSFFFLSFFRKFFSLTDVSLRSMDSFVVGRETVKGEDGGNFDGEGVERIESFSVLMEKLGIKRFKKERFWAKQIKLFPFVFLLQLNLIVYSLFFFFYFEIMLAQFILYDHKIVRFILICFLSFCHNCDIAGKTIDTIVLHSLKIVLKNLCLKFRSLKIRSRIR